MCFNFGNPGAKINSLALGVKALDQWFYKITINSRHQLRRHLYDTDFAAQGQIYRRHFKADNAAADDQQPGRNVPKRQCAGRVNYAGIFRQAG